MLMSHNTSDQEADFFLSFLYNAINGDDRYKPTITSLLKDAKSLANGTSVLPSAVTRGRLRPCAARVSVADRKVSMWRSTSSKAGP